MNTINTKQAGEIIRNHKAGIFSVSFIKRTDGTLRRIVGRRGVTQDITGKGLAFDPEAKSLLTVREFIIERSKEANSRAGLLPGMRTTGARWRMINVDGIRELRIGGKRYKVVFEDAHDDARAEEESDGRDDTDFPRGKR